MVLGTGVSALASLLAPALPCLPAASIAVVADMVALGWEGWTMLGWVCIREGWRSLVRQQPI